MDHMGSPPLQPTDYHRSSAKRKRSLSLETTTQPPPPPQKAPKTHSNHLQINYLARQFPEILPLISPDDPLPSLLSLISDYDGVLQRHESMAGNLGARPLGPILIQRFERLFDGPPRVLKSHGKEGTNVGWLDVVEFARNKPDQFNLEKMRDGVRVCQFYTKQCRVEISEEDYVLVASGMPQKLIPPQPIGEDEEKELGTLEILERNLGGVVQLADQVSARARQLNHRLKNRRNAIISRREAEAATAEDGTRSPPTRGGDVGHSRYQSNGDQRASNSPTSGFVAVNSKYPILNDHPAPRNGSPHELARPSSGTVTNGTPLHGASAATRAELLSKFHTNNERSPSIDLDHTHRSSISVPRSSIPPRPKNKPYADSMEYAGMLLNAASPVPIPNTPSSLLPYVKPSPADRFDDSGPYKADMMARMEQLSRGDRVQPPCDRCRRLHMDCLKNLTACMGCTKKHAKCSWKDVDEQELKDHPFVPRVQKEDCGEGGSDGERPRSESEAVRREYSKERQGVRDEELLGEESGDEDVEMREKPAVERRYSIQSSSPPTFKIANQPQPEGLEALPPPAHPAPTLARPVPHEETAIAATPAGAPISSYSNDTSDRGNMTSEPTVAPPDAPALPSEPTARTYQAPEAKMHRWPSHDTNFVTFPTSNQAKKANPDGPMRVYIVGSEPLRHESLQAPSSPPILSEPMQIPPRESAQMQGSPLQSQHMPTPSRISESLDGQPVNGQSIEDQPIRTQSIQGQAMQT